jgi:pilus assembly protein Flp/PilA
MSNFISAVKTFAADENGVTAIEYGLIAAVIGVVMAGSAKTVGEKVKAAFDYIAGQMNTIGS